MKKYSLFALYLFLGESLVRLLGFFANAYLGRTLGPAGFGLITIGTSFLTSAILVSDSGLRMLGLVETAKPAAERRFRFSDIFLTRIVHTLICGCICAGVVAVLYQEPARRTITLLFLINILYEALFLEWYYNGLQRFRTIAAARIVATAVYAASVFVFVKSPGSTFAVPLMFFGANMTGVVILFLLLPSTGVSVTGRFSPRKYIGTIKQAIPLGTGAFLIQVTVYLPPVVLGKVCSESETGLYGAALKIVVLLMAFDKIFSTLYLSSLPGMWHNDTKNAVRNLQIVCKATILTGFFIALMVSLTSALSVPLIFGDAYPAAAPLLSILSWFFTASLVNSIFAFGLIAIGRTRDYVNATAAGFLVNCVSITMSTVFYGVNGAAVSAVAGEALFIYLCFRAFRKYCAFSFFSPLIKTVFSTCCAYGIAAAVGAEMGMRVSCAAAVFLTLTLALRTVSRDDFRFLISKWNNG
jgi:O-antigen/teichoic acid export membrane protein